MTQAYYRKTPQQALEAQNASAEGLSAQEARRRAEQYGPNKLSEGKKKSTLQVFLEQFKDLMVLILIIAAVISAFSGNVESTIVIFAVLVLNAILGTVQYEKAEKSLESLKAMASPTAKNFWVRGKSAQSRQRMLQRIRPAMPQAVRPGSAATVLRAFSSRRAWWAFSSAVRDRRSPVCARWAGYSSSTSRAAVFPRLFR